MDKAPKSLDSVSDVVQRAYGTKLERLRRRELELMAKIHGIQHPDMIKDDLVAYMHSFELRGYDLWTRPEKQERPSMGWPEPVAHVTPKDAIEGSGTGRTTRETLERQEPERHEFMIDEEKPKPATEDKPSDDEWDELRTLKRPTLVKLNRDVGQKADMSSTRDDLVTQLMAHVDRDVVKRWIIEYGSDKDPA